MSQDRHAAEVASREPRGTELTTADVSGPVLNARIPGSKSLTSRAVLIAAGARGTSRVRAPLVSDDTIAFRNTLTECGARVESSPLSELTRRTVRSYLDPLAIR